SHCGFGVKRVNGRKRAPGATGAGSEVAGCAARRGRRAAFSQVETDLEGDGGRARHAAAREDRKRREYERGGDRDDRGGRIARPELLEIGLADRDERADRTVVAGAVVAGRVQDEPDGEHERAERRGEEDSGEQLPAALEKRGKGMAAGNARPHVRKRRGIMHSPSALSNRRHAALPRRRRPW
ncbi:MAG: hypothetical protein IKO40_14310, partial [Kiritimatiellae bacterium]|nr:hypothetical protein [Kiritimatiellia bacterium]